MATTTTTNHFRTSPVRLPSIDSPSRGRMSPSPPAHFGTVQYNIMPPIPGHQDNSESTVSSRASTEPLVLLPDIGESHPCPYVVSEDVDLRLEKVVSTNDIKQDNEKELIQRFRKDKKFAREVIGLFLEDVIEDLAEEITRECFIEGIDKNSLCMPSPLQPVLAVSSQEETDIWWRRRIVR
ncbi:uncharacterized protein LOC143225250 isoform X2 [Tachypleus tridentatus]|uniref:uncharacterized protein LOC143225250 isoform X2 n=1 Tax=Tachypleus tridentatus TaxID=6853 RepID=UPI003FD2C41B